MRRRGDTGENLVELLERRLDATVYRMKLAPTPFAARQIVNHGHVLVNGKRVNIPSYQMRDGDTIELKQRAKDMVLILEASRSSERDVPDYVEIDHDRMRGRFVRAPKLADVPYPVTMEPNLVVEYYSRSRNPVRPPSRPPTNLFRAPTDPLLRWLTRGSRLSPGRHVK